MEAPFKGYEIRRPAVDPELVETIMLVNYIDQKMAALLLWINLIWFKFWLAPGLFNKRSAWYAEAT